MQLQRTHQWMAAFVVMLLVVALPAISLAQSTEDEPLRLVYVDGGVDATSAGFDIVYDLLDDSSRIDVLDADEFIDTAADVGVEMSSLTGGPPSHYGDDVSALMWSRNVEVILVHQYDSETGAVFVTAVGPEGRELTTARESTAQGELDGDAARAILEQIFSEVVPDVRQFRRQVQRGEIGDDDFQLDGDDEETLDLREAAARAHREQYGNLQPHIEFRAGGLVGHRGLKMNQPDGDFEFGHETMLFGVAAGVDSLLTTIDRDTAAFEVGGFFAMSPFSSTVGDDNISGRYLRLGADARYISALSATTRLRAIGGIETANLSFLDAHDEYTGSGYLNGRIGAGVHYTVDSLATLQIDALLLPIISASNSGGAYGEPAGWLGFGGDATLRIEALLPLRLNVDYSLQYLELDYPEPVDISGAAHSRDMFHTVMITAGYRL